MRYHGLLLAVPAAFLAALVPATAGAAAGATLTVPAEVQASPGANPVLKPSFSYPEPTPFCTVGVDFTWDGAAWLTEFPSKSGSLCVVTNVSAPAPTGHGGAGTHQVCASAGPQYRDCKTVTVVLAPGQATTAPGASPKTTSGATAAPTLAPLQVLPSVTPAAGPLAPIAKRLPPRSSTGLVLLAVGAAGLVLVVGRRLLARRRRPTPLPGPQRHR